MSYESYRDTILQDQLWEVYKEYWDKITQYRWLKERGKDDKEVGYLLTQARMHFMKILFLEDLLSTPETEEEAYEKAQALADKEGVIAKSKKPTGHNKTSLNGGAR